MNKHIATGLVFTAAVAAYSAGFAGLGGSLIAAGVIFELWFWRRVIRS